MHNIKISPEKKLNISLSEKFKALKTIPQNSIEFFQTQYLKKISQKLSNPTTYRKGYWSLSKALLNNKNIFCIPPLFHDIKFAVDFREKLKL